jgi:diguanylate cyclase (GGDEF)-like protein
MPIVTAHVSSVTPTPQEAAQEAQRLSALRSLEVLDTPPDPDLDRLTRLVAHVFNVPTCLVSMVDSEQLWFKARCGFADPRFPRETSICHHVVMKQQTLVISDLSRDPLFSKYAWVQQQTNGFRFYAGAPLRTREGHVVGTLCLLDTRPRTEFTEADRTRLSTFADVVMSILQSHQQRLEIRRERELLSSGPVAALIWDTHTPASLLYRSGNLHDILGEAAMQHLDGGQPFEQLLPADRQDAFRAALQAHALGLDTWQEITYPLADGERWVQQITRGDLDNHGQLVRVRGFLLDVTATKRMEASLRQQEAERRQVQRLQALINEAQQNFLLSKDIQAACEALFEPLLQITGSRFGFIGITHIDEVGHKSLFVPTISNISWDEGSRHWYEEHQKRPNAMRFNNLDNLFGHVVTHGEVVLTNAPATHSASRGTPKGHPNLDSFLGIPLSFNGEVLGMIGLGNREGGFDEAVQQLLQPLVVTLGTLLHARVVEDQRQAMEEQLRHLATVDALTQLANRRAFMDAAEQQFRQARRYQQPCTLALLDLDHFKRINDEHGHAGGDAALKAFSQVMKQSTRETDLIGRVGGEEFAVLLTQTSEQEAWVALERIRQQLSQTTVVHGNSTMQLTVSIGMAPWHSALHGLEDWLTQADHALYGAKSGGRNCMVCATTPSIGMTVQPAKHPD